MTSTVTKCDHCDKDLAPDSCIPKYRIALNCVALVPTGPVTAMVLVQPPFKGQLDFCDLECLAGYLNASPGGSK